MLPFDWDRALDLFDQLTEEQQYVVLQFTKFLASENQRPESHQQQPSLDIVSI